MRTRRSAVAYPSLASSSTAMKRCWRWPKNRPSTNRALAAMDMKVFLVPGTDGSCRAVREAMAMGVPVIAARRGVLPAIVSHDRSGILIDHTPERLAAALVRLAKDPGLRQRLGAAARSTAVERFSLPQQAERVLKVYRSLSPS